MSMAQLSPTSILGNPAEINPVVLSEQQAAVPKIQKETQKTVEKKETDTVTLSRYALKRASTS